MHYVSIHPIDVCARHHVRGTVIDKNNDYLLEIASNCAADSELLALCALAPEIRELLEMYDSPLAEMLLAKWATITKDVSISQWPPSTYEKKSGSYDPDPEQLNNG